MVSQLKTHRVEGLCPLVEAITRETHVDTSLCKIMNFDLIFILRCCSSRPYQDESLS